ncbi:MAG: tetratricopeptide repeat protein [Bacteroidia bacterium]|nr:tetratricopeptide repeat protein [Bacteroidia bacterium]
MEQDEKPKIAELKRPRAGCFWLCVLITIIFLIFLVPRYGWGIMALTSPVIIFGILDLISYFEEDAKTRPLESADAYYSRGIKKLNLHYYKEAINDFTYAIGLDPRHITSFLHRGLAKTSLKDYKGALSDYNHAIRLDPDNKVSYFYRGRLRKDYLNDYKGAITDYTKSIEGAAYDEITYENRGNSKYKLKDYNGAIADYSKAIETSIEPESLFFYRGNAKYRLGDFGGAIADFSQSIEHDPYYADAYFNRGVTKERMNDHNEAIIDFNKAIEIAPKNKEVYSDQSEIKDDLTDIAGEMVDLTWVKDIEHYFEDTVDNKKAAEEVRLGHEKAVSDHIKVTDIIPEQVITFFHKRSLKWIVLTIVAFLLVTVGLFFREKEKKGKIETEDREKSIQKENTGIVADSVPVADNVPVVDSLLNASSKVN